MDWLKTVLPTIATALGGPLAGIAVKFVADKLDIEDKTIEAVQAAISGATPEQLVQLKQTDADLQRYFAGLGVKMEEIDASDRANAREREMKTGDYTPKILAGVIMGGFLCMAWYVIAGRVPLLKDPTAAGMIGTVIGYVSAKADQVVSYYFGSSSGSKQKTDELVRRLGKQ